MKKRCINLRNKFGKRYRIEFDPAYNPKGVPKTKQDHWMMVIPCRRGFIYPQGGQRLAVEVHDCPGVRKKMEKEDYLTCIKDGDGGGTFIFHVKDFKKVAKYVKPYSTRKLTEKQKKRLADMGRKVLQDFRGSSIKNA